jgi:hypothetical protein
MIAGVSHHTYIEIRHVEPGKELRMLREYQQRPVASSETQSVVRFEPLNLPTDEVHHAIREVVHRTGDLDRSFLLQVH